jgi:hypothetical protein
MKTKFIIHTVYHSPVGFQERGHNSFCFVSRCGRWHAREGNYNTMILTDRTQGDVHVIKGKMPEVQEFINTLKVTRTSRG